MSYSNAGLALEDNCQDLKADSAISFTSTSNPVVSEGKGVSFGQHGDVIPSNTVLQHQHTRSNPNVRPVSSAYSIATASSFDSAIDVSEDPNTKTQGFSIKSVPNGQHGHVVTLNTVLQHQQERRLNSSARPVSSAYSIATASSFDSAFDFSEDRYTTTPGFSIELVPKERVETITEEQQPKKARHVQPCIVSRSVITAPLSVRIIRRFLRFASVYIPPVNDNKPAYAPGLKNVSFEPEPPDDGKRVHTLSEKDQLVNSFRESYLQVQSKDLDIVGHVVQTANFAAAYLDSRGGFLSVDQCDVNLYVPPGALSNENDPKLVYIYVTASAANGCVTPSVHCGPSDLDFMKDVILTIPHCVKDAHLCQFTCSKKSSNKLSQIQDGENGIVLVDSKSLLIATNHFCEFTAVAAASDPKEKIARYMTAGVFWNGSTHKREVRVRLRLFQSTKAHLQEVEIEEKRFGFVRVEPCSKLGTDFPGGDVVVKITSHENTWKLQEGGANLECCTKIISYATLCETGVNNQDVGSNVLFYAAGDATSTTSFEANMEVYQKGKEKDKLEFFVHKSKVCADTLVQPTFGEQLLRSRLPHPASLIPKTITAELIRRLDDPSPVGNDWRLLPELLNMGNSYRLIHDIETRAKRFPYSPTEVVLNMFIARELQVGSDKTVLYNKLRAALIKLKLVRQDAVLEAIPAINKILEESEPTANTAHTYMEEFPAPDAVLEAIPAINKILEESEPIANTAHTYMEELPAPDAVLEAIPAINKILVKHSASDIVSEASTGDDELLDRAEHTAHPCQNGTAVVLRDRNSNNRYDSAYISLKSTDLPFEVFKQFET